ncbi:hypothetical protein [Histophilus somni]|uniref:hypothetical protein n=1 Tax=Histophilus somni TaxID=731 RepID=UPI00201F0209|nr:hypothetical protein [Histophilus somni]
MKDIKKVVEDIRAQKEVQRLDFLADNLRKAILKKNKEEISKHIKRIRFFLFSLDDGGKL